MVEGVDLSEVNLSEVNLSEVDLTATLEVIIATITGEEEVVGT